MLQFVKDIRHIREKVDHIGVVAAVLARPHRHSLPMLDKEWRDLLKKALVDNRSGQTSGSGDKYWESVVETVEDVLNAKRDNDAA